MSNDRNDAVVFIGGIIVVVSCLVFAFAVAIPLARPWWAMQYGKSELARAEQNRQILIKEAMATKDSAVLLAEAEVARARGVAKANEIIGSSLKNNKLYLKYLWIIEGVGKAKDKTVVYVPTEAQLPILEATRLRAQQFDVDLTDRNYHTKGTITPE